MHPLNKKCKLEITIIEAKFLKDSDMFGKQDPYIVFKYGRSQRQTTVAEDAGKHAIFNEKFELSNVLAEVEKDGELIFDAMEKDVGSSDLLGSTAPIKWKELCEYEGTMKKDVDILFKGKKAGNLVYKYKFIW